MCRTAFCADGASFQCYVFPANNLLMIVLDFFNQGRNFITAHDPSHSFDDINDFLSENTKHVARAVDLRKAIIAGTETLTEIYEPLRTSLLSMVWGIHAGNTTVIAEPTSSYMPRTLTEAPSRAQIIRITPDIVRHDADIPFDARDFDGTAVEPTATAPMWREDHEQAAIDHALVASLVDSRRTAALDPARTTHEQRELELAIAASRETFTEEESHQVALAIAESLEDRRPAAAPTIPAAAASHPTAAPATPPAWARAIIATPPAPTLPTAAASHSAPPSIATTSGAPRNLSETLRCFLSHAITLSPAELSDALNGLKKEELLAVLSSKDERGSKILLARYVAARVDSAPAFEAILERLHSLGLTEEEAAVLFGDEHTSGTLAWALHAAEKYIAPTTTPAWARAIATAPPAASTIPAAAAGHPTASPTTPPAWADTIATTPPAPTLPTAAASHSAPPSIATTSGAPGNPSETLMCFLSHAITLSPAELSDALNRFKKKELLDVLSSKGTYGMMLLTHYVAVERCSLPVFEAILKRLQSLGLTVEEATVLFGDKHTGGTLSSICDRIDVTYREIYRSFFSSLAAGDEVRKLLTAEPSDDIITKLTHLLGTLDKKNLLDILNSESPDYPMTTLTSLQYCCQNERKKYPVILARLRELKATQEEIIDLFDRKTQPNGRCCLRRAADEVQEITYHYFPYLDPDYKAVEATTPDTLSTTTRPNPT